ncbi:DUF2273 domain-containing protein [Arthrobacter agilis]|uniref:DUF2273 domain-containing protein n=1 Tax=Arthrobacter agilis TaxID=37921 RepID=UPI000B35C7DE|nr:DUF2273 domain-containing protein [Arthrobacter agilis]OUM40685.1 hypothetical protein B8W74_14465 [Arthrobacter agilis]PPB45295.1 DUF2273 domain-containing protein [Arthrobacter agilis]TPV28003.1 DUF2273 domain-containing protein [Arthrobacter agilis]WDF33906.1 DUF2273 domain-containing protein [Arthrobacter agilis]VDR31305.1 Uncharacterised protein [Arthrobacter agilis]
MSRSTIGLFVGLLLGIVAVFGGFLQFIAVVVFATLGLLVGRYLDGRLDVQDLLGRRSSKG